MPDIMYAPGAGDAPSRPACDGLRADQTRLALFFFLRLNGQTMPGMVGPHFWSARGPGSPLRRPACGPGQKKGRKNMAARTTTRKPLLLLRLFG
jgi:hypothetical protein